MQVENQTVGKSVYAMNQLDMGAWKDTRLLIDKWFLSFDWMKRYIPQALYGRAFLTKHKDLTLDCNLDLKYQERAEGDHEKVDVDGSEGGKGLFSWFGGQKVEARPQTPPTVLQWQSKEYHGSGITIGLLHVVDVLNIELSLMFGRMWGRRVESILGALLPLLGGFHKPWCLLAFIQVKLEVQL